MHRIVWCIVISCHSLGYRFNPSLRDSGQQEEFEQNAEQNAFLASGREQLWTWGQEEEKEASLMPDDAWLFPDNESVFIRLGQSGGGIILGQQPDQPLAQSGGGIILGQQPEFSSQRTEEEEEEARQPEQFVVTESRDELRRGGEEAGIQSAAADTTERPDDGGLTRATTTSEYPTSSPDSVSVPGYSDRGDPAGLGVAVHRGPITEFNKNYPRDFPRADQVDFGVGDRHGRGPQRAAPHQQQQWASGGRGDGAGDRPGEPSRALRDDCINTNTQQVRHTGRQSVMYVSSTCNLGCFRPPETEDRAAAMTRGNNR